ncbi:MAG TPA: Tim44/TimA family putative adaptor protein [Alphaproteobacteria bacterium]|nr:Tim44/TimA family putative adaptor protein [Alphaproteobacteria bacterium]
MGDGFAYLDIVLLAMVAAFLIYRLRGVLGRRTGNEKPPRDPFRTGDAEAASRGKTPKLPDRTAPAATRNGAETAAEPGGALGEGLRQIAAVDPSFTADSFLAGARTAFTWIVEAFGKGDAKTLRPLLNDDVYGNFSAAIEARAKAGESLEAALVGIKSAEILEARLNGRAAFVTVKFVSEQVNVTRNSKGEVIDGDPVRVVAITDIWTFARDLRARDPNWSLVATRSPN